MKFKIDENLPVEIAHFLQHAGYDALTVYDQKLTGEEDSEIAEICNKEKRAIVTMDLDFADIRAYPPKDFAGLIVLRLKRQDKLHVLEVFQRIVDVLAKEQLAKCLWIVEENRIRIRK